MYEHFPLLFFAFRHRGTFPLIYYASYIYIGLNRCYKNLTHLINFLDEAKVKLQQARSSTASYFEEHICMRCMTINGLDSCSPVHY